MSTSTCVSPLWVISRLYPCHTALFVVNWEAGSEHKWPWYSFQLGLLSSFLSNSWVFLLHPSPTLMSSEMLDLLGLVQKDAARARESNWIRLETAAWRDPLSTGMSPEGAHVVIRTRSWGFLGLGEYSVMVSLGEEFPHGLLTKTSNHSAETLLQQTWLLPLCWYLVLE